MALKDTATALELLKAGQCRAGQVYEALPAEDQATITEWATLKSNGAWVIPASSMARGLADEGHMVSRSVLQLHLAAKCCCTTPDPIHGVRRAAS